MRRKRVSRLSRGILHSSSHIVGHVLFVVFGIGFSVREKDRYGGDVQMYVQCMYKLLHHKFASVNKI